MTLVESVCDVTRILFSGSGKYPNPGPSSQILSENNFKTYNIKISISNVRMMSASSLWFGVYVFVTSFPVLCFNVLIGFKIRFLGLYID